MPRKRGKHGKKSHSEEVKKALPLQQKFKQKYCRRRPSFGYGPYQSVGGSLLDGAPRFYRSKD